MTVFFNITNLRAEACNNYNKFLELFNTHCKKRLHKKQLKKTLHGLSYILNPWPLFEKNSIDILYKIQYIELAALRDYSMYKLYRSTTLDLSYFPDLDINKITTNPLLKIQQNQIHFLYEEN